MTLNEFKAWLEGFEEAIDGAPTEAQWKKVKEILSRVDAERPILQPLAQLPGVGTTDPRYPVTSTNDRLWMFQNGLNGPAWSSQ